jgi:hypothetical protein
MHSTFRPPTGHIRGGLYCVRAIIGLLYSYIGYKLYHYSVVTVRNFKLHICCNFIYMYIGNHKYIEVMTTYIYNYIGYIIINNQRTHRMVHAFLSCFNEVCVIKINYNSSK